MVKFREKELARNLRRQGKSVKEIAEMVGVSKSTVSLWCNDILISKLVKRRIIQKNLINIRKGALIAGENRKKERLERVNYYKSLGMDKVGSISKRELFLIGAALYWAEGGKNQRRVVFINSDPRMILLWVKWLENCFNIKKERLICRLEINEKYKESVTKLEEYWSKIISVSKEQFTKVSLKKSKTKKVYKNDSNYKGSLQITVSKGTNLNYEILGYIEGLAK